MDQGMHVLLADDEAGFRYSASVALRGAGYRVTVAADGREAFARIVEAQVEGDPVQILVTDQMMPNVTGAELVDLLRARGIRIPVVIITAYRDLPAGACSHPGFVCELVEKPIDPENLVACLKRVTLPDVNPA
jgi:CheY-like chemotaxis protein